MKTLSTLAAALLVSASFALTAAAHDHSAMQAGTEMTDAGAMEPVKAGDLTLSDAFTRATLPGAKVGGGYVTIVNGSKEADRLIGGSTPVAERVEVHEMKMDGSVMKMRQLKEGLEIPAGETVKLAPGGLHLMMMGLKSPLKEGDMVPVTLEFAKAGKVELQLMVGAANATDMGH
ncbi:copper chaperone PCu(A)C [Phyllobacterium sp. BT25]|uniref:Copper chaperone PCu(A)C n=1 Tax=Phyllobacterium pellucidum TaxID=2740464 RepID=A0A849VME4_9HYPH|nr:copper chaperone PCu(A)C [Phyllobacterium pellucidum]NTS30991.1 copper chaperone PCu(A)C [Phyllobacterium pellucidum]